MTDEILLAVQIVFEAVSTAGIGLFAYLCLFSRYMRPFIAEANYNRRLWRRGQYSIRTGLVAKGAPSFEESQDGKLYVENLVDAALEWAK